MDYEGLRVFLSLSRTLHFGRTSKECHKSASAVSRTLSRLEEELGHILFERDSQRVRLTPQGERFAQFASEALGSYAAVQTALAEGQKALRGTLTLFASVTACQSFLPALLTRFREAHPDVHLQLETGYAVDALAKLEAGEVDVTVAALPERVPRHLVSRVVIVTPLVFVAPVANCEVSRQVEKKPIPWGELPLVLPPHGLAREAAERWLRAQRVRPRIYGEPAGNEAILALVSTGCGVGVVPKLVVEKSPLRRDVRPLDLDPALGEFRVGVCTERSALANPLIDAFWRTIA